MNHLSLKNISIKVCLLAFLVVAGPTCAEAELLGTLDRGETWSLEFAPAGPTDEVGVTVTFIDSRGRQTVDVFTILIEGSANTLVYSNANLGNSVRRIIIDVDFPIYHQVATVMSIWQGPLRPTTPPWNFPVVNEGTPTRYVFNVGPGN